MGQGNGDFDQYAEKVRDIFSAKKKGNGRSGGGGAGADPKKILLGILIFIAVLSGLKAFYTVEADEEGVVTRFGKYIHTSQPGLHFKVPWVDQVYKVKSKRRQEEVFGYRARTREQVNSESLMLTGDLNLADVEWMVQYEISDPWRFLFRAADVRKAIRDVSMSVMRRVVGDRLVGEVLTTGRMEIATHVKDLMQETLDQYDLGIRLTTVELQSVTPPDRVKAAFNDVNAAKQEQEQAINRAERKYNSIIPEARGKAEQQIAEAQAYAKEAVNKARGDANRFKAQLTEYKKAPLVTRKRLYIETMEEVLSNASNVTVVDEGVKGLMPIYGQLPVANQSAK
ncbi:FtsH protease activity modulator HflK [Pseudobacteriovorax antillogorgiicola]|uniref:Protein HflK n=1 Tax=Pseudobacteriovorax antillogorgiicola TaxID=1513793 RepID=A0A1Y6BMR7_9BACT|nr:FtsH protease activity modulator HflK [Pseudobacteriovorax antillogorgiicola]TCS55502.1 protease FtsH subunit HflK [Pseudobacteriovorax antillogorgiicola]SMF11582.1 protease FtsH subunit HflK [Pseudobacteriovorax antillogorgiicola]